MANTELLEKGILEVLPQIPFVVDQVSEAMQWAKEDLSEGEYYKALIRTYDISKYAAKISEPNFFKYHLIIVSLLNSGLKDVKNNERFRKFDTASGVVEKTLDKVTLDQEVLLNRGCFKALLMHLVPLATEDQECFTLMLYGILNDLKEICNGMDNLSLKAPITQADYITILGYSYVITNLYLSDLHLLNEVAEVLNEINITLNNLVY